ncbi:MAG: glycosyltransferase family 2 protein, partial [Clostridia bacterium]|nr:glycosyltransferase family 2 protein [Clostridia bacterium]
MVDILMATYNSEKYIKEQLDSILSQTIANWRLVIRDDCSSDNTLEILKAYEAKYPEHIFVHQAKTNSGGADKNFFELINYALYDYVMFCDQDDVWENNKVELSLKKILALEQQYGNIPLLVHCDAKVVDDELNLISNSLFDFEQLSKTNTSINKLIAQNNVTGCTMMVNKTLLDMIKSPHKND